MNHIADVYIGIGSNLEQPIKQVQDAIAVLSGHPLLKLQACSSLYRSAPVGVANQPEYINVVCHLQTGLGPGQVLRQLQQIENAAGRIRDGERWGPRTLDLDLLLYDDLQREAEDLTIPHPRMHERAFVLYPLRELVPGLEIPGRGPVGKLAENCGDQNCSRLEQVD